MIFFKYKDYNWRGFWSLLVDTSYSRRKRCAKIITTLRYLCCCCSFTVMSNSAIAWTAAYEAVLHDLLEFAQEYIAYIVSSRHTCVSMPVCVWACVSLHPWVCVYLQVAVWAEEKGLRGLTLASVMFRSLWCVWCSSGHKLSETEAWWLSLLPCHFCNTVVPNPGYMLPHLTWRAV